MRFRDVPRKDFAPFPSPETSVGQRKSMVAREGTGRDALGDEGDGMAGECFGEHGVRWSKGISLVQASRPFITYGSRGVNDSDHGAALARSILITSDTCSSHCAVLLSPPAHAHPRHRIPRQRIHRPRSPHQQPTSGAVVAALPCSRSIASEPAST